MGGFLRAHAALEIALDVLHHDDGVVDDNADRQHQAEQRQVVQGNAERIKETEGADQRDRDRNHRNDRGTPALQEQEDDADHQQDRDEDRLDDLVDGFADEDGGVIDDLVSEAGRKILAQLLHRIDHFVIHGQRIGARLGEDQEWKSGQAVHIGA